MYSRVVNQSAQLCLLIEQYTWHIINIEWNPVSKTIGNMKFRKH